MLTGKRGGVRGGRRKGAERGLQLEPQERSDYYFPELCLSRPYPDKTFAFVAAIVPGRELGASAGEGGGKERGRGGLVTRVTSVTMRVVYLPLLSAKLRRLVLTPISGPAPHPLHLRLRLFTPAPPLPYPPAGLYCSLSVSTPFLLGVLFLSSPSSSGDTAQSLDICKSLCDAGCRWMGADSGAWQPLKCIYIHVHKYIYSCQCVCVFYSWHFSV